MPLVSGEQEKGRYLGHAAARIGEMKEYSAIRLQATVEDSKVEEFLALLHSEISAAGIAPLRDGEITVTPLPEDAPLPPPSVTVTTCRVC